MNFFKLIISLGQNIVAGTRAALFMPFYLWSFKANYIQVCLLLLVSLSLSLIHDYFDTAPDNYFNPYGLSYQALLYLLFFFSLSLIAYLNSQLKDILKLTVLLLSIVPVIWLGTLCLLYLSEKQIWLTSVQAGWAVFVLYLFWYLCTVFRLIKRFFYLTVFKTIIYVCLYGVINITPLFLLPAEPLWYATPAIKQQLEGKAAIDIEDVYSAQGELLDQAVANLWLDNEETIDVYFIGFAGDAEEDVFMNETKAAKGIMENKFNAYGRSLLLINNSKTIDNYPLANYSNLKRALKKTATKMDVDNDVLFLFLTSHGSEDHDLSVNFPVFKLKDIDAESINSAIIDAGIKWKIIVISACYSGGFISSLTDPHTLVITAASADRNSFGCGHDGKYTYFGKAFFEDSLQQNYSLVHAFEHAVKLISDRENEAGFTNSNPQIKLGEKMEQKLTELEKQLQAKKPSNWAYTEQH